MRRVIMKTMKVSKGGTTLCADTLGAQINSFNIDGKEYIWQRDEKYWGGSAPILFPIVGELKGEGKTTKINGKAYHMRIHGFARDMEFVPEKVAEDKMVFTLKYTKKTLKQYPYKFTLKVEYTVTEDGFSNKFYIINNSKEDMPYVIGAHPAFNLPMFDDEFQDYTVEFEKAETDKAYRIDEDGLVDDSTYESVFVDGNKIPLQENLFDKGALIFQNVNSTSVKLYNKQNHGIKMDFGGFDYFGIWKMPSLNSPYLCLEPWTGMNDCYSEDGVYKNKRGIRFLSPKQQVCLEYKVTTI